MKVAIDASCLAWPGGGIARYLRSVIVKLAERPDLELVLLVNSSHTVTGLGHVNEVPKRRPGALAWRHTALLPYLVRHRPDVFWAPWPVAPLFVPCPMVITVHDLAPILFPGTKPRLEELAFHTTARRTARRATRVLSDSQSTTTDVINRWGIPAERITTTPLGVDDRFVPGDRGRAMEAVRQRWGIPAEFVLMAGTIEPRKGVDVLLDWVESDLPPRVDLVLAGRAGYSSEAVLARAHGTDRCFVLGQVSDDELIALYQAAAALVVPSLYEGFGLTPLEAMACGTPAVLAKDSGALVEMFGEVAQFASARTPEGWAAAIESTVLDRDRLGPIGMAFARRHTWDQTAGLILAALNSAAGTASTREKR